MTAMSALGVTVVVALDVSFAEFVSKLSAAANAVFAIDTVLPARITSVNCAEAPLASVAKLHDTMPFVPTAGVEHDAAGPVSCTRDTNVVPGGSGSLRVTLVALSGPAFASVSV